MLDEMAVKYLSFRFSSRFSRKVRDALVGQLPNGEPSKQETARLLAMTERTLLRRLREENTTFQEVLDSLREELDRQRVVYGKRVSLRVYIGGGGERKKK